MSLVNLLYSALETGNWSSVSEAYFILTGERVSVPENKDTTKIAIDKVIQRLEQLEKIDFDSQPKPKPKPKKRGRPRKAAVQKANDQVAENFSMKPNKPERTVKAGKENKFESMLNVVEEAEKEKGFDLIDDTQKREKSTRNPYKAVEVSCAICEKMYNVNPLFARETYTCDKCLTKRK